MSNFSHIYPKDQKKIKDLEFKAAARSIDSCTLGMNHESACFKSGIKIFGDLKV